MIEQLNISDLQIDRDLQMREAGVDVGVVADYAEALTEGTEFPPIIVFYDGENYWPGDGFHRIEAHKKAGRGTINSDVRQGNKRDAVLLAAGANANHGLRRSTADKRRSVVSLLRDPEWAKWSDRQIGKACGVDHKTVGKIRIDITSGEIPQTRTFERNGREITMKVAQREAVQSGGSIVNKMLATADTSALVAECRRRGLEVVGHED